MWKSLVGKTVKIVFKDGDDIRAVHGKIIDANDSFVINKDRFGKLYFLNTQLILRVDERSEKVENHE